MQRYKYFPEIWGAIAILACLLMLEILISTAFYDAGVIFAYGDPRSMTVVVLANGIVFSTFMKITGIEYKDLFHPSSNSVSSTLIVSVIPLAIIVISSLWWLGDIENYIVLLFPQDLASINMLNRLLDGGFITVIAICVIAPFVEEMLFRGIILRGFLIHYSPINAIVASSALFGLIHLNIYQIPGAFVFGCIIGYVFYLSKSLWPCIFAHSLANALSYLLYIDNSETYFLSKNVEFNSFILNALTFCVSVFGMYLLYRIFSVKNER